MIRTRVIAFSDLVNINRGFPVFHSPVSSAPDLHVRERHRKIALGSPLRSRTLNLAESSAAEPMRSLHRLRARRAGPKRKILFRGVRLFGVLVGLLLPGTVDALKMSPPKDSPIKGVSMMKKDDVMESGMIDDMDDDSVPGEDFRRSLIS